MMRKLMCMLFISCGLFSAAALAGPGHEGGHSHGPVTGDVASEKAM